MKQKILLFMLLVMAVPVTMMADNVVIDNVYYSLNTTKKTATVKQYKYTGDIVIPDYVTYNDVRYKVTSTEDFAFCNNGSDVTTIIFPSTMTSIGNGALSHQENLTSVTLPNNYLFKEITRCLFWGCTGLTSINIPNGVVTIGESAFADCTGLTSINLNQVQTINNMAFEGCTGLTSIVIPKSVKKIYYGTIRNCTNLISISVDENNIYYDSRNNCNAIIEKSTNTLVSGINNTVIPNSVTIIESLAFEGCTGLTSIDIPSNVTCIRNNAFTGCTGLTSIIIPSSVTDIWDYAFSNCNSLQTVTCNATSVPSTSSYAFNGNNLDNVTLLVPEEAVESYKTKTPWSNFGTIRPADVTITISSVGMATYCSPYDLDFSGITDFKACIATGYNRTTGNVIMQPVSDAPAGTGLYLQGTPGEYQVPCGESGSFFVNLLVGTTAATTISPVDGNYKNLILYNGSNGVGFYTIANDYPMGANKAYLQLPAAVLGGSAGANRIGVEFEDNLDGIENIDMIAADGATWYSLNGCKLNGKPIQKGIYVVNGRKVVIK